MTPSIVTMEEYYAHARRQTLWEDISKLHIKYLDLDDSPQKLIKRHELEDTIREFLSITSHEQKFLYPATANVLCQSASTKRDFSGYRAALGWNAIAMYAANLWNQPWREEFKHIKLYSGYFKHQVDSNLAGAEIIFQLMGYRSRGDEVLMLDGPICPDMVLSISQDALVAYVECQVLKAIWEEVASNFKISWLDVLEFRQRHVCSIKQCIQALNYRCQEQQFRQHSRSHSQGTDFRYCSSAITTLPSNHSFPPIYSHPTLPLPCVYNNGYPNNYPIYAVPHPHHYQYHDHHNHAPIPCSHTYSKSPLHNSNCQHLNGCSVPTQSIPQVCPTGQLIEVESQHCNESSKSPATNNGDSWDYVYKNLENQGYCKDLGERGDVLNNPLDMKARAPIKEAKVKSNTMDKMLGYLNTNDKKQPTSAPENGYVHLVPTITTTIDMLSTKSNLKSKSKTMPLNNKNADKVQDSIPKWQCATCTYLNDQKHLICEMCSKSKKAICDEMEIGGSQCSNCTLVNPKENKECSACRRSLKGSPTYI